jgi:hypothetical protein
MRTGSLKDEDVCVCVSNEATRRGDIAFHIAVCPALLAVSVMAIFALPNVLLITDYTCFRSVQYRRIS